MSHCSSGDWPAPLGSRQLGETLGLGSAVCPLELGVKGSCPSEFSSISWMSGGIEPGISIFKVITRSAPFRKRTEAGRERGMPGSALSRSRWGSSGRRGLRVGRRSDTPAPSGQQRGREDGTRDRLQTQFWETIRGCVYSASRTKRSSC